MKKFLLVILFAPVIVGCASREKKAAKIARTELGKMLYYPNSYQAVATTVDSAKTSIYSDPEVIEYARKIYDLSLQSESEQKKYDDARSSMALWSNGYDSYFREQYRQAKADMKKAEANLEAYRNLAIEHTQAIKDRIGQIEDGKFYGWIIRHRYRAKNNDDKVLMGDITIIVDEKMGNVLDIYDDDEEYMSEDCKAFIDMIINADLAER